MDRQRGAATWNSEKFETFRQQLDSETPPDVYRRCSVYQWTFRAARRIEPIAG